MPRGKPIRNKNGYGTVVKLSGNRRNPYEVRVNTRMDERYYPVYDVLGRFEDRETALFALAQYNKNPYDLKGNQMTFSEVYTLWYDNKFNGKRKYSNSSMTCTKSAYTKCKSLHGLKIADIRTHHMQLILDDFTLSHAYMEQIRNLLKQVFKFAMLNDYITKNYADYITINKEDDDEHGIPFTTEEISKLWNAYYNNVPDVDMVLMLIYSGWRIGEFLTLDEIDLQNMTMRGGVKTEAGKNRLVPIHTKIADMINNRKSSGWFKNNQYAYSKAFKAAVAATGITTYHTAHDCRHTFVTLLSNAGADSTSIKRLVGHSSDNVTEKIYTHKDIEQLRKAIQLI